MSKLIQVEAPAVSMSITNKSSTNLGAAAPSPAPAASTTSATTGSVQNVSTGSNTSTLVDPNTTQAGTSLKAVNGEYTRPTFNQNVAPKIPIKKNNK